MSILIKGMKMQTRCVECPCAYFTEGAYWDTCQAVDDQNDIGQFWKSGRPDWCPLVEVPTPHGRLIDAGALTELVETEFRNWGEDYDASQFLGDIEDAPTIIEAEE